MGQSSKDGHESVHADRGFAHPALCEYCAGFLRAFGVWIGATHPHDHDRLLPTRPESRRPARTHRRRCDAVWADRRRRRAPAAPRRCVLRDRRAVHALPRGARRRPDLRACAALPDASLAVRHPQRLGALRAGTRRPARLARRAGRRARVRPRAHRCCTAFAQERAVGRCGHRRWRRGRLGGRRQVAAGRVRRPPHDAQRRRRPAV